MNATEGTQWLARTQRSAPRVLAAWNRPPYLASLKTGRGWDALLVPQRLGLTVLHELRELGAPVEQIPVLEERSPPRPNFYILTKPGVSITADHELDVRLLGAGSVLKAPAPDSAIQRVTRQEHHYLWRHRPDGCGTLADPRSLTTALELALDTNRQEARHARARRQMFASLHRGADQ
ncbi:hypothetical protein [Streptomyces sp. NPDC056512]|uniref:hypothetical protein n=1 Tax=Streptomyces sp. NPDC056512 TaxID=3345846 RepID=UPI00368CF57F